MGTVAMPSKLVKIETSGQAGISPKGIRKLMKACPGAQYICDYAWRDDQVWTVLYREDGFKETSWGYDCQFFGVRIHSTPINIAANQWERKIRVFELDNRTPFNFKGLYSPSRNVFAYSRYQHDFFYTSMGFALDGGCDYLRIVGHTGDAVNAYFDPMTMKVYVNGDTQGKPAVFSDKTYRNLRGKKTWKRNSGSSAEE